MYERADKLQIKKNTCFSNSVLEHFRAELVKKDKLWRKRK